MKVFIGYPKYRTRYYNPRLVYFYPIFEEHFFFQGDFFRVKGIVADTQLTQGSN